MKLVNMNISVEENSTALEPIRSAVGCGNCLVEGGQAGEFVSVSRVFGNLA